MIDELERNKYREEILKLLRTSTDGGYILRGTPRQKSVKFGMRHIVWISSIEMNLANLADASRFFQFEPQRPERTDGKRPLLKLDPQAIKRVGFDLMVFAIKNMQSLLQTVKTLSEADIDRASPRNIESAAVPAAFAEQLCGWSREETLEFMHSAIHDYSPQQSTDVTEDHDELLQAILSQTIKVKDHGELSVVQTIGKALSCSNLARQETMEEALERNGVKLIKPRNSKIEEVAGAEVTIIDRFGKSREVFFHPVVIRDNLLKNTDWKSTNVKQLLNRITGAREHLAKYGGKATRGICIPLSAIFDGGHLDEPEKTEVFPAIRSEVTEMGEKLHEVTSLCNSQTTVF